MTSAVLEYLAPKEWAMGNGQCPECYGANPDGRWDGHPCYPSRAMHGHKSGCRLAEALAEAGVEPTYLTEKS